MDFVALDFETANENRDSACALGLVVVENNEIVKKDYWLIRPKELYFNPFNISIHGITPDDVKDKQGLTSFGLRLRKRLKTNMWLLIMQALI
jgi:DNA polymerase III subunit epsilon